MARIVICGAGFGGLPTAHHLREDLDEDHEIVVVDQRDEFYMGFAKLWDLSGQRPLSDGTRSLSRLEAKGIRFVSAAVEAIDPDARVVEVTGETLHADAIVVALGTRPAPAHAELLASPDTYDLYDPTTYRDATRRLSQLGGGRVVVAILGGPFKCPPAPYEAMLIIDDLLRQQGRREAFELVLATPQPLTVPAAGVDASRFVADRLEERGVVVLTEHVVTQTDQGRGSIRFANGDDLAFDLLLGVPADAPLPVVADSAISDDDGWIRPDPHVFATAHENVFAVGDCTVVPTPGGALPHAGVFAAAAGRVVATNVAAAIAGAGETTRFEGHGYCFLELPGEEVAFVEGDFYADPPQVELTEPSREQFDRKRAFEREHLDRWLP